MRVFLKREDLNHTGSHKINNVLGQALLVKRMGKTRVIAETGAGQHGVATATAAALLDLECVVYMGEEDTRRQALNVARMRLLGAEVIPVTIGTRTLKDAINEALRDWVANVETTHYLLGTVTGPHPFPEMVRDFHKIIGEEAKAQLLEEIGRLPDAVAACVGGGSNAMGIFNAFLDDPDVRLFGFEAGGEGISSGRHAARFSGGEPGVLHGAKSYLLQDDDGQTLPSHSVSAGLDYPSVGPEHAWLHDIGRADYRPGHRRRGHGGVPHPVPDRGHHPGDRVGARPGRRDPAGPRARRLDRRRRPRARAADQPVGPRGQGRGHGRGLVRPDRRRAGRAGRRRRAAVTRGRRRGRRSGSSSTGSGAPRSSGYLPVGYPSVDGSVDAVRTMIDAGVGHRRARRAVQRPGHGRPGRSSRPSTPRWPAAPRCATPSAPSSRSPAAVRPILVMTYWNLVLRYGVDAFARDLASAGGAGLITPDLIPDEAADWIAASDAHGLDRVFLVAPSSTPERLASTSAASRGLRLRGLDDGRHGGAGDARRPRRAARRGHPRRRRRSASASASASRGRSRPREVARYADGVIVGLGARAHAARRARRRRPAATALARLTAALADGRAGRAR